MLWILLLAALAGLIAARPALRADLVFSLRAVVVSGFGIPPRRVFGWRLWLSGLSDSALGRRWRAAATAAPVESIPEHGVLAGAFAADRVQARVVAASLRRGGVLLLRLRRLDDGGGRLFADLERDTGRRWRHVASLTADGGARRVAIDRDAVYRVVLQPEPLTGARYRLALARGGSLVFPVVGGHAYDIGGGFGASRGGGRRRHRGVDIFAARGTPVRAVTAGTVHTAAGGIGGRHIWLSSGLTGPRFYYAHLDAFAVADGARVDTGTVIGRVGNTGNASATPPHLHFGIYTAAGAIDPAPFIRPRPRLPRRVGRD